MIEVMPIVILNIKIYCGFFLLKKFCIFVNKGFGR